MAVTFEFADKTLEEKIKERERLIKYLKDHYPFDKVKATLEWRGGYSEKKRLAIFNNDVFQYAKGRKRYGSYMNLLRDNSLVSISIPEKRKTDAEIWEDSWKTALGYLEQSGLFEKYADNIRIALEIGFEGMQKARAIERRGWDEDVTDELKAIHKGLVYTNSEGNEVIQSELIWKMSRNAEIKTIYFGKYRTDDIRQALKEAMENKEPFREFEQVPNYYDVSVSYDPERMTGSYSEEYRGYGNGHYYLLLDHEHALFYEDD